MKEVYLGPDVDCAYIKAYLENIRRLDPIEITTLSNAICLNDDRIAEVVNIDQFRSVAYGCLKRIRQQYGIDLDQVSEERYYTAGGDDGRGRAKHGRAILMPWNQSYGTRSRLRRS
jgi:hypothetical protein